MSLISEQIFKIRHKSHLFHKNSEMYKILHDAADTIEELSAKLANANMERSEPHYNDEKVREAVKKQEAKKIVYHDNCGNPTPSTPRCPCCFEEQTETWYMSSQSWCRHCGQKISWE